MYHLSSYFCETTESANDQLPFERVSIDCVFRHVEIDYAAPFYLKLGHVLRSTIVKEYTYLFLCHSRWKRYPLRFSLTFLQMSSSRVSEDLSHGVVNRTSFGVIKAQISLMLHISFENSRISLHSRRHRRFCFIQHIKWKYIPKCAPHFDGLWKAVVKSMKTHLRRIVSSIKLTYEELTTVLAQVECCLNSRPLVALP